MSKPGTKFTLASKTVGLNLVLASISELIPSVGAWIVGHPQTAILMVTAANIAMRHFTGDGLTLKVKQ